MRRIKDMKKTFLDPGGNRSIAGRRVLFCVAIFIGAATLACLAFEIAPAYQIGPGLKTILTLTLLALGTL